MNKIHCVFIKDSRVANVAVFETQDDLTADNIIQEHGYDDKVWVTDSVPEMYSKWDGNTFEKATPEYLFSIGVIDSYRIDDGVSSDNENLATQP